MKGKERGSTARFKTEDRADHGCNKMEYQVAVAEVGNMVVAIGTKSRILILSLSKGKAVLL